MSHTIELTEAARIRQRLARREAELQTLLRACTVDAVHPVEEHEVADFKDMAIAESQATVDGAQAAHALAELHQLHQARVRLEEGRYGVCLDCGDAIDPRRLAALPATAYCPSCQQAHEQRAVRAH
ncbi:MAG TPA: TraR/DksA family transcriptional regulator [Ramlibacter sp.]|nr:TraR/DksA family transcriptional regulator [Ramlibacter sp.]